MDNNYNNDQFNNDQFNNDQQNVTPDNNQAPMGAPFNQAPMNDPYNGSMPTPDGPQGKAIASMVLGIASLVFGCCPKSPNFLQYLAFACAIVGLVLGIISRKNDEAGKGFAIAGIVCSIVYLALIVIGLILIAVLGVSILGLAASAS